MISDPLDREIMEFVKDVSPSGAYIMGFNECAGKLFNASEANVNAALRRARALRSKARPERQRRVLVCVESERLFA